MSNNKISLTKIISDAEKRARTPEMKQSIKEWIKSLPEGHTAESVKATQVQAAYASGNTQFLNNPTAMLIVFIAIDEYFEERDA